MVDYDSAADTLRHIVRVAELLAPVAAEIAARGPAHDRSKLEDPEKAVFDEYTPKLKHSTYGSDEYKGFLQCMGEGLAHHYEHNRHHPEHFTDGIDGMTLVDLIEMLADWKAATERHDDGDLARSLKIQQERFGMADQLARVLENTARRYGWLAEQGRCEAVTVLGDPFEVVRCDATRGHEHQHGGHDSAGTPLLWREKVVRYEERDCG